MKAVFLAFTLLTVTTVSLADVSIRIFTPQTIKKLLGPYPMASSEEEKSDFDVLRHYQLTRTEEECLNASKQENATLQTLFVEQNGPLTRSEARELTPGFLRIYAEAGANIYLAKRIYKRPRPYITNPEIVPCIDLEKSHAYPSGHTTLARVFARLLSKIYPERSESFMKRADEASLNRVLGGVHHPTDIIAGKKLGDALAEEVDEFELKELVKGTN